MQLRGSLALFLLSLIGSESQLNNYTAPQVFDSSGQFVQIIGRQGISAALLGNQGSGQGVFHTPCGVALSTGYCL